LFAGQNVIFTGKLAGEELSHAYASMDIFVHCGTEETFGQTIQEAQASGLAVIAPNVGGPSFLIDSGKTGVLVNPSENKAYRFAVVQLVANPQNIKTLGESARQSVIGKSWTANNEQLVKHYRNAIDLNTLMRGLLVR
jgi:phosphatidylinositol alpha 1,6-mannosyltransferase